MVLGAQSAVGRFFGIISASETGYGTLIREHDSLGEILYGCECAMACLGVVSGDSFVRACSCSTSAKCCGFASCAGAQRCKASRWRGGGTGYPGCVAAQSGRCDCSRGEAQPANAVGDPEPAAGPRRALVGGEQFAAQLDREGADFGAAN